MSGKLINLIVLKFLTLLLLVSFASQAQAQDPNVTGDWTG